MDLWIHDNVPWELEIQALRRGLLNLGGQWSEPTLSCKPYAVLGTCTLPDLAYAQAMLGTYITRLSCPMLIYQPSLASGMGIYMYMYRDLLTYVRPRFARTIEHGRFE